MYAVTDLYKQKISAAGRRLKWRGTLTTKSGAVYQITPENICKDTGKISMSLCSPSDLNVGNVMASQLDIKLFLNISRYQLFDAVLNLRFLLAVKETAARQTWGDISELTWEQLAENTWDDLTRPTIVWERVPVGRFTIKEAERDKIGFSIVAYDNMLKFDAEYRSIPKARKIPYTWIKEWCAAVGVSFGMTKNQFYRLPNSMRKVRFASTVVEDVKTYRDALSYMAAMLCCNAAIDRRGKLVLVPYKTDVISAIPPARRFSSELSDYICYYTGVRHTYKEIGETEYKSNTSYTGSDNGLVLNLGTNPFMQITNDANRSAMLQSVINAFAKVHYAPYKVVMPCDPAYDLGDVLRFTGNQAASNDIGAITEMDIDLFGHMTLKCAGENPGLAKTTDRMTKNVSGLLDGTHVSREQLWMLIDETTEAAAVPNTPINVNDLGWEQPTDRSKLSISYTGHYNVPEPVTVGVDVQIDGESIYSISDIQYEGTHYIGFTIPYLEETKGAHSLVVYLSAVPYDDGYRPQIEVTLPATGWESVNNDNVAPYAQTISIVDVSSNDRFAPIYIPFNSEQAIYETQITNLGYISGAVPGDGEVTFYCFYYKPTVNLTVYMDRSGT